MLCKATKGSWRATKAAAKTDRSKGFWYHMFAFVNLEYEDAPSTNENGQKQEPINWLPFIAGFLAVSVVLIGGGVVVYYQKIQ